MNRDKRPWWQERIKASRNDWINFTPKDIKQVLVDTRLEEEVSEEVLKSA